MAINSIKRIKIENIKGKEILEWNFDNLLANKPNIIVAPNGYGKSTIATAFQSFENNKIKLKKQDRYYQSPTKEPSLEIEMTGDVCNGIFSANETTGNFPTNLIDISVIDNILYAKNTSRKIKGQLCGSADLRLEDIILVDKIPSKINLDYSLKNIKDEFGEKGDKFKNISNLLISIDNIKKIYEIEHEIKCCIDGKKIQCCINTFLDNPNDFNKSKLESATHFRDILSCVKDMSNKPTKWNDLDDIYASIQICHILNIYYSKGNSTIRKIYNYLEYKEFKENINSKLSQFNTTGRELKAKEEKSKLIIKFERADTLSNGERDILTFMTYLSKYEVTSKKKVSILIIDEIFDYLDGTNLLLVQYYLKKYIDTYRKSDRILYPIILTHLDPAIFTNFYFSDMKIHYVSSCIECKLNAPIIELLKLRNDNNYKDIISKYYLHFTPEEKTLNVCFDVSQSNIDSNIDFRKKIYAEILDKYLKEKKYNPLIVIAGLRIKIEELIYNAIKDEQQKEIFINTHKTKEKLNYATSIGISVDEVFYLLQPLYNDGLHLGDKDYLINNKIKSSFLKLNNIHIRRIIKYIFIK